MNLGRLKQVELKEIWKHEAYNFTTWLAKTENLDLLSEEIDIELSLVGIEHNVGRFKVDIYAEESVGGRKVIIENQLEKTDHDHLGKLITYASGLEAEIIIWIVKDVLEEHRQAIDWLNEHTDEDINFFAIRMELWKIGESIAAPKFHVISKPNDWSKSVKSSIKNAEISDLKALQLKFWNSFKEYSNQNKWNLRLRKTYPQHWYDISFGRSDCHVTLTINSQKSEFGCEIYIPDSPETYKTFLTHQEEINLKIEGLDWMELPAKKASRIKIVIPGDLNNESKWFEYFDWLGNTAVLLQNTFINF